MRYMQMQRLWLGTPRRCVVCLQLPYHTFTTSARLIHGLRYHQTLGRGYNSPWSPDGGENCQETCVWKTVDEMMVKWCISYNLNIPLHQGQATTTHLISFHFNAPSSHTTYSCTTNKSPNPNTYHKRGPVHTSFPLQISVENHFPFEWILGANAVIAGGVLSELDRNARVMDPSWRALMCEHFSASFIDRGPKIHLQLILNYPPTSMHVRCRKGSKIHDCGPMGHWPWHFPLWLCSCSFSLLSWPTSSAQTLECVAYVSRIGVRGQEP